LTSALNENKLQVSEIAQMHTKKKGKEFGKSEIITFIYEYKILISEKHTINSSVILE